MANSKKIHIKESVSEIKKIMRGSTLIIRNRLSVLLEFKRYENTGISKIAVANATGFNQNSVQTWRSMYVKGGISALTKHNKKGYKPSKITKEQEAKLYTILHNPENGFAGYVELQHWFNTTYNTIIEYNTFRNFIVRKFNSKIKVARKSHINKNEDAVAIFKKTLVVSAKQSTKKK